MTFQDSFHIETDGHGAMHDLTERVEHVVAESGVRPRSREIVVTVVGDG